MSRAKPLLPACLVAILLGALIPAATASAGEWDINGTKLVGTAALLNTALVLSPAKLEYFGFHIECVAETIGVNNGLLEAPDELLATSFTLKECSTPNMPECSIIGEAITTLPVRGLALLDGPLNTFLEILPKTKAFFAVFTYVGERCFFKGEQTLGGGIDFLLPEGAHPRASHLTLAFSLPEQLKPSTTLTGLDVDIRLASGQTWNFL